jgi:Spy/CpxP family protein refolding chaperone
MILKTLSVIAVCVAFSGAAGPISAERASAGQNQAAGKTPATLSKQSKPQTPPPARPKPWWLDENTKKELGLNAQQVKSIDDIFTSSKDEIAGYRETMNRENKELDKMVAEGKVEQWVVLRQIDRMEAARSNHNKTYWMMLYRMNRALTPEQRVKLQEIERRMRETRGGRGGERRDPKPAR